MIKLLYAVGNKRKLDIGQVTFDQIAAHGASDKVKRSIGFASLSYELVIKQCPSLKADHNALSGEPFRFNVDPKLFTRKVANDIAVEQAALGGQEDVQPSSSFAGTSQNFSAAMKEMIFKHLEAEIKEKTVEIKKITSLEGIYLCSYVTSITRLMNSILKMKNKKNPLHEDLCNFFSLRYYPRLTENSLDSCRCSPRR